MHELKSLLTRTTAAALAACLIFANCTKAPSDQPSPLDAYKAALAEAGTRPIVVNFWATWCTPCQRELPLFVKAHRNYGNDVFFIGVDVQDDKASARKAIKLFGMRYKIVDDPDGTIQRKEKVTGLPVTKFLTSPTKIAFVSNGEIKEDVLTDRIERILQRRY